MTSDRSLLSAAWSRHERRWADNLYVYAVVSRRSSGLSVGINLNPSKACNFNCIYCQVDRTTPPAVRKVDLRRLAAELDVVLESARSGSLFERAPYSTLPIDRRSVHDIAFSGDGEPTTSPRLQEAIELAADARRRFGLGTTKLVLITDAAYLAKPAVRRALEVLDANNGEIWAKLDAGTEEYFGLVNRPNVPFSVVLDNILDAARLRPITIQSLWMRVGDALPPPAEIEAYCGRLGSLVASGGKIKTVQLYTIARKPTEPYVSPLTDAELDHVADIVRAHVAVPVEIYYGVGATPASQ